MVFKIKYLFYLLFTAGLLLLLTYCSKNNDANPAVGEVSMNKIGGVSFAVHKHEFGSDKLDPVLDVNADYICFMPFAFGQFESPELTFDLGFQWWGETTEGIMATTTFAREKNLKILLKPHIWFWHGQFTGDFMLENEADWLEFENNYKTYILHFARLADSLDIEMFCIGVELKSFIAERPAFWDHLIDTVRSVYTGKVVYAANWDNFKYISFWDRMDYIGIDAYFPLSDEKTPNMESLLTGWEPHLQEIADLRKTFDKQVLFTEYGYKSIDYTAKKPWNPEDGSVNLVAQQNAYEATFRKLWAEEWFAGGFLWKWYTEHETSGGLNNKDYTPQNKPVEETIREYYGNN